MSFKIYSALLSIAALAATLFLWQSNTKLRNEVRKFNQCEAAIAHSDHSISLVACSHNITKLLTAKAASDACAASVANQTYSPDCPNAVSQLVITNTNLKAQLQAVTSDRDAAITRAASRANSQNQRKAQDAHVIQAAPRGNDGIIICDANCLRARFQN